MTPGEAAVRNASAGFASAMGGFEVRDIPAVYRVQYPCR